MLSPESFLTYKSIETEINSTIMKQRIDEHTLITVFEFLGENWARFQSWCESRGYDADEAYDEIEKATR